MFAGSVVVLSFRPSVRRKTMLEREAAARWLRQLARVPTAERVIVVFATAAVLALAAWQSRDRVVARAGRLPERGRQSLQTATR